MKSYFRIREVGGGGRRTGEMEMFGDFVDRHNLMDIHFSGMRFTWSNFQENPSLSRLDRFLIPLDWGDLFSPVVSSVLPRPGSNHVPLVLQGEATSSGPKPFHFHLIWLLHPGFKELVVDWWNSFVVEGTPSKKCRLKLTLLREAQDLEQGGFQPCW